MKDLQDVDLTFDERALISYVGYNDLSNIKGLISALMDVLDLSVKNYYVICDNTSGLTDEGVKLRSDAQDEFDLIFNLLSRIMYL
jgi:hypothetical protein